jgi:hypothetical protein
LRKKATILKIGGVVTVSQQGTLGTSNKVARV